MKREATFFEALPDDQARPAPQGCQAGGAETSAQAPLPKRNGSATRDPKVVDSWNHLVFLFQERDRHGRLAWNVRLILGDLNPFRYGPLETEKEARAVFKTLTKHLDGALWELGNEAAYHLTCCVNEEF